MYWSYRDLKTRSVSKKALDTVVLRTNKEADSIKKQTKAHVENAVLFFSTH